MKEAYYFRHDCNARNDQKIIALRIRHKMEGYGIYWSIIEMLRESASYMCTTDYNIVAFGLHVGAEKIKSIVEDFGLFEFTQDGKYFYSKRLLKDMQVRDDISETRRKAINKRWDKKNDNQQDKRKEDTNAIQMYNTCNTIKEKERKEYNISTSNEVENIEKEIIKEKAAKRTAFVPPTLTEVQEYISEKGFAIDAEHFIDFYTSKGWMVGANKMKDWRAAVRTWKKRSNDNTHTATNASRRGHVLTNGQDKDWDAGF